MTRIKLEFLKVAEVRPSGNGAVIYVPKKFIGRQATISIEKEVKD